MLERSKLLVATAAVLALTGCVATPAPAGVTPDAGTACTGVCNDGGTAPDGGAPKRDGGNPLCNNDGLHFSVAQVRAFLSNACPAPASSTVSISNAVVTGQLTYETASANGIPGGQGTRTDFWVADAKNPRSGIWVEKFTTDYALDPSPDYMYNPQPGDRVTLLGFALQRGTGTGSVNNFISLNAAGRFAVTDQYNVNRGSTALVIEVVDSGTPLAPLEVDAGFGNAQGGSAAANPEYAGARVHIPGPLVISNAYPVSMADYTGYPPMADTSFFGYEVSTPGGTGPFQGILVADEALYQRYTTIPDGGPDGGPIDVPTPGYCDYGAVQRSGGTVVFPDGIWGVWDTYAIQPCAGPVPADGGYCANTPGEVAFSNGFGEAALAGGGYVPYLYVLWPLSCSDVPDGGL